MFCQLRAATVARLRATPATNSCSWRCKSRDWRSRCCHRYPNDSTENCSRLFDKVLILDAQIGVDPTALRTGTQGRDLLIVFGGGRERLKRYVAHASAVLLGYAQVERPGQAAGAWVDRHRAARADERDLPQRLL